MWRLTLIGLASAASLIACVEPVAEELPVPEWNGLRAMILRCYLSGRRCTEDACQIQESGSSRGRILSLDIQLNQEGIRVTREIFSRGYLVTRPDGSIYVVEPPDLTDQVKFRQLRSEYLRGADVQRVGFRVGLGVPQSNLRRLFLADSLADSLIEEVMGRQARRPQGFSSWTEAYIDKPMSRLYAVNPETGLEGRLIAWLVDVYAPSVRCNATEHGHFVLKQIIPTGVRADLPTYLVTRPSNSIFDGGETTDYRGEVVDDTGAPVRDGVFTSFAPGRVFFDINGPASR